MSTLDEILRGTMGNIPGAFVDDMYQLRYGMDKAEKDTAVQDGKVPGLAPNTVGGSVPFDEAQHRSSMHFGAQKHGPLLPAFFSEVSRHPMVQPFTGSPTGESAEKHMMKGLASGVEGKNAADVADGIPDSGVDPNSIGDVGAWSDRRSDVQGDYTQGNIDEFTNRMEAVPQFPAGQNQAPGGGMLMEILQELLGGGGNRFAPTVPGAVSGIRG